MKYTISVIPEKYFKDDGKTQDRIYIELIETQLKDLHELSEVGLLSPIVCGTFRSPDEPEDIKKCPKGLKRRKIIYLKSIQFLMYDFDKGHTPEEISKKFTDKEIPFVMLASKNHNKKKDENGNYIPKFHVLCPLDTALTSDRDYKDILDFVSNLVGFKDQDHSCRDSTRLFTTHSAVLEIQDSFPDIPVSEIMRRVNSKRFIENAKRRQIQLRSTQRNKNDKVDGFDIELFIKTHSEDCNNLGMSSIDGMVHSTNCKLIGKVKRLGGSMDQYMEIFNRFYSGNEPQKHYRNITRMFN